MRAAYDNYNDQGFEVLSVSIGEAEPEIETFVDTYGLDYQFAMDRTGEVAASFSIASTPTTYFIDPEGRIVDSLAGVVNRGWLQKHIDHYLSA